MKIEQFVMAYSVEQDRIRAALPEPFRSLRPVLRINAEIRNEGEGYLEFNTPVEKENFRGWLNIEKWDHVPFKKEGDLTVFTTDFLQISFRGVGAVGGCPAEKDNQGCYFLHENTELRIPERVESPKEFCDCAFSWRFKEGNAEGKSIGKTLPAFPSEVKQVYPREPFTAETMAAIPCIQVLGSYKVLFDRKG